MSRFSLFFVIFCLFTASCGDDSGPPAPPSDGGSATDDSGLTPVTPPDPNACKLANVKAYILSGFMTINPTGVAVLQINGEAEPGATVTVSFSYQGKSFKKTIQLDESGNFGTAVLTSFKTMTDTMVTIVVSKASCTTFTAKVLAKFYD